MLQSKSKIVETNAGRVEVIVTQLPAMRSGKLLMRLSKNLAPALARLATTVDTKAALSGALDFREPEKIADAVRDLFTNLDGDELEFLTHELLGGATIKRGGEFVPFLDGFDAMFAGRIVEWFGLLWFALEVNYGNFTGALGGHVRAAMAKARANPSPESNTSSGPANG